LLEKEPGRNCVVDKYLYAVNRTMAFEAFKAFGYENVVDVDCFRVLDD
jgi:hypothetical protein